MAMKPALGNPSFVAMRATGFTIIELMVAIAVFAILAAIAMPNFSEMIQNQRARGAASDLFGSLLYARSEAIKRNTTVTVARTGASWDAGWTVSVGATVLKRQEAYKSITIGSPNSSVSFGSNGRPLASIVYLGLASDAFTVYVTSRPSAFAKCLSLTLSGMPAITDDPDTDRSNGC